MIEGLDIWIWLGLMIIFIVGEMATVGLVSIWFAAGSLVSLLVAIIGGGPIVQVIVFFIVSILLLFGTKPWAEKVINSKVVKSNTASVVGQRAVLTEEVNNLGQTGAAVVQGKEWTVRAENDNIIIPQGALVEVVKVTGVKLIVKWIKEV